MTERGAKGDGTITRPVALSRLEYPEERAQIARRPYAHPSRYESIKKA